MCRDSEAALLKRIGVQFEVDAATLDFVDEGRGPALVLLHGFPLAKECWDLQATALAANARVIRLDLRGLGRSSVVPGPVLMETLAGDVASLLDGLGIERAVIAGHSLGTYVAFAFYRLFAERVAGLGLVCGRSGVDDAVLRAKRYELAADAEREGIGVIVDFFLPRLFAPSTYDRRPELVTATRAMCERTDPRGAAALLRGMAVRIAADDLLPGIDVPVRVIAGAHDAMIGLDMQRALAAAIPGAHLDVLESGHTPPLEAPGDVTRALEQLLAESAVRV